MTTAHCNGSSAPNCPHTVRAASCANQVKARAGDDVCVCACAGRQWWTRRLRAWPQGAGRTPC
jgi:hypothetical protein